jgi:hypothetical protein
MAVVDNFGTPDVAPAQPVEVAAETPPKSGGFLSTTVGKLVVGGIVLVVVLGALAAIGTIFFLGQSSDESSNLAASPSVVTSNTASASSDESVTPRPEPALQDTFAFRNIFEPTIKITLKPVSDTTDGGTADVPDNTLYLAGVSTVDGEPVAELVWNGTTYTLSEGESIPNTPWQVLSIDTDTGTVVMLYGDSRITLTVGQGISK